MSKVLNSTETCEVSMGEEVSATVLESTVRRLAEELGLILQDTTGISYVRALEGNNGTEFDYHRDFDGYECFKAVNGDARFAVSKVENEYMIALKNKGKNLFECALKIPHNSIEKKLNLRILIPDDIRSEPEKSHEPLVDINEIELGDITSQTVLKYLS